MRPSKRSAYRSCSLSAYSAPSPLLPTLLSSYSSSSLSSSSTQYPLEQEHGTSLQSCKLILPIHSIDNFSEATKAKIVCAGKRNQKIAEDRTNTVEPLLFGPTAMKCPPKLLKQ